MESSPPFYSPEGLATLLGVPVGTIYRWNATGSGPRRIHVGKHVRYRATDVEKWLERQSDPEPASR